MKKLILILFVVLALAGNGWGAGPYYVKNGGSDAANGLTPATAWAHHPWDTNSTGTANGTVLAAGETVYMRRGDTFYATGYTFFTCNDAGSAGIPVTTTSIDTFYANSSADAYPVISGALNPVTLTWVADGTSYKAATPDVTVRYVMYNGIALVKDPGAEAAVALNKWDYVDEGAAGRIYINVGESPSAGTALVSIAGTVLNSTGNYQTFSKLTVANSGSNAAGAVMTNATGTIYDDIVVRDFWTHGIYLNSSTSTMVKNSHIYSTKVFGNTTNVGVYAITSTAPIIVNNHIHDLYTEGVYFDAGSLGKVSLNQIYNTRVAGVTVKGTSHGVFFNRIYDIWNGVYYGGGTATGYGITLTSTCEANLIYNNFIYDCYEGIRDVESGTGGSKIFSNWVKNSLVNSIDISPASPTNHTEVYGNQIIHNPRVNNTPAYTGHAIAVQGGTNKKAKIFNNFVVVKQDGDSTQGIFIFNTTAADGAANSVTEVLVDNNLIDLQGPATNIGNINGTNYKTLATWQAAAQTNAKIKNLAGTSNLAAANDFEATPLFMEGMPSTGGSKILSIGGGSGFGR